MRAFVTGATGFLGINLMQELAKENWEIFAFHRPTSNLKDLKPLSNVTYVTGDVTDRDSVFRAMPEGVDAVFHVAGSVGHLPAHEEGSRYGVNQDGTRNVVDACLAKKIGRLVYTSTVLAYDFHATDRLTEDSAPNLWCKDAYIESKRLADEEVVKGEKAGLDIVTMRPSAVFGAYDKQTWSKLFLEIQRGLPAPFAPPGGGSVCHAKPVAAAHIAGFHRGRKGQAYILGGPDVTWLQVMKEVAAILGKSAPVAALPTPLFKPFGHIEHWASTKLGREPTFTPHSTFILCETVNSDSSRAIRELGYQPSSLKTMLMDCYQWMLAEKMLPPVAAARNAA